MKALLRSLALWASLAGISWLLLQPDTARSIGLGYHFARLFSLTIAAVLTRAAVSALPAVRSWRWSFWTITMAGWLAVALLLQGQLENDLPADDQQILTLAIGCAIGIIVWLMWRGKRVPRWSVLGDMAVGVAILGVLGGTAYWKFAADMAAKRERAVARWREIGMPLSELDDSLKPEQETAGSETVRNAFRDILGIGFYKVGTRAADREPVVQRSEESRQLVNVATEVLGAMRQPSDRVIIPQEQLAKLETRSAQLEAVYRSILSTEPAAWACDPRDGASIDVPNFLGVRMFTQLASAESIRRVSTGDLEGATRAIAACKRMAEGLDRNPTLVSLMIHVAVDALLAPQEARLDIPGCDTAAIERDAREQRQALVRVLQWESWAHLQPGANAKLQWFPSKDVKFLPQWTRSLVDWILTEHDRHIAMLNSAERAAVRLSPEHLSLPDLGSELDEAISRKHPSAFELNVTRSAMRMNAALLLREQAQIIREARERLASGQPLESRNSVVLPHVRWEVALDPAKRAVSTRMVNAPKWITDNVVTGSGTDFWLLPLDGSASWQFAAPAPGTAATREAGAKHLE